jgi:hypothetical protein
VTTVPEPRHGGTFFYCDWQHRPAPGTVTFCWRSKRHGTRFRTARAYRRHWRRHHAP